MKHTSQKILRLLTLCAALSYGQVSHPSSYDLYNSHPGAYSMADRHFRGVLFPEAYKSLPSTKIAYPGLWVSERSYATAGLLIDPLTKPNANWSAIYGWADIDNEPGAGGLWIGNFNWQNEARSYRTVYDSSYYMDSEYFSLRGAAWVTPGRGKRFKGISVTVDIDNAYAYDGNEWQEVLDKKSVYIDAAALIMLNDAYHLRLGGRTYNTQSEDPNEVRQDVSKLYADGLYAGIVDDNRRTLDFRVDNVYQSLYSWEKTDTLSFALRYSHGGAKSYMRHMLFFGLTAGASASFGSKIGEDVGTFEYRRYVRNLTADGWVMRVEGAFPIVLDVSVYGPLRLMLSAAPTATWERFGYKYPQHKLALGMEKPELSLRGTVGKMFDFAVRPTVENDVFIAGIEIRYRF